MDPKLECEDLGVYYVFQEKVYFLYCSNTISGNGLLMQTRIPRLKSVNLDQLGPLGVPLTTLLKVYLVKTDKQVMKDRCIGTYFYYTYFIT